MTLPGQRLLTRYASVPHPPGSGAPWDADELSVAQPFQETIAEMSGIGDSLDQRVVRAYWTGNELTDAVEPEKFGHALFERVHTGDDRRWRHLDEALLDEAAPTHCFQVFGVSPWSRFLGRVPEALRALDNCRIRWGEVVDVREETAVIRSSRLIFNGKQLSLGTHRLESLRFGGADGPLVAGLQEGDLVAVHWGSICDRLTEDQAKHLKRWTERQLDCTNRRLPNR